MGAQSDQPHTAYTSPKCKLYVADFLELPETERVTLQFQGCGIKQAD